MNEHHRTANFVSLLFACVVGASLVGGLVASACTSNNNDNERVTRRTDNSNNNNAGEISNRAKPKPRGSTSGTTTGTSGDKKRTNTNQGKSCKGRGCNQKGTPG